MTGIAIGDVMTRDPYTVSAGQPLSAAHRIMREHGVRHLPVVRDGRLVGMVTQRDLHLVETLRDVDPEVVLVEEAMTAEPYAVAPTAPLAAVARAMAASRHGSAVIVDRGAIVGVFTSLDALRLLARLTSPAGRAAAPRPAPPPPGRRTGRPPRRRRRGPGAARP